MAYLATEKPERRAYRRPSCLYFVHAAETKRLKIGIACDPLQRLSALRTGNAEPLVLMGWTDYSDQRPEELRALERDLHNTFDEWRMEGEWFQAFPSIMDFAHQMCEAHTTPEARALAAAPPPLSVDHRDAVATRGVPSKRYRLARGLPVAAGTGAKPVNTA